MDDRQEKYFQFPLFLLRDLLDDPGETLTKIAVFGFFRYAASLRLQIDQVAKRVIYSYNTRGPMDPQITKKLKVSDIEKDEDYRGFYNGSFDPPEQVYELIEILNSDQGLFSDAYRHAQIETARYNLKSFYNISFLKNIHDSENWYRGLTIPDREPFPQISIPLLLEYLTNDRDQFSLLQLAAFIGINSILGRADYKKTNKAFIVARMFGYKSPKEVPAITPPLYDWSLNRYHFDSLKTALQVKWKIHFESKSVYSGYYIARAGKISLLDLKVKIKTSQLKSKAAHLKEEERKAEVEAQKKLQHLYK
jgi:hypothetical protein